MNWIAIGIIVVNLICIVANLLVIRTMRERIKTMNNAIIDHEESKKWMP